MNAFAGHPDVSALSARVTLTAADYRENPQDREAAVRVTDAGRVLVTRGEEDFLEDEILLASLTGNAVERKADRVVSRFSEELGTAPRMERVTPALEEAAIEFRDPFTDDDEEALERLLRKLVDSGSERVEPSLVQAVRETPSYEEIRAGISRSTKYYTNNYFNRIVVPDIEQHVAKTLADGVQFTETFFEELKGRLARRLKSVPYWRTVANGAASRAYHYGVLRAGQVQGYRGYQIQAVVDERTTDVCRHMNGKQFWLADGLSRVERIALAEPEELATVAPWFREEDVLGKNTAELRTAGAVMPPFHANCRTTIFMTA